MMSLRVLGWVAILLAPCVATADAVDAVPPRVTAEQVQECVQSNVPKTTSIQTLEFISVDRVGNERLTRAKVYGKRFEDGLRKVLLLFTKPRDLRGSAFLMLERADGNGSDMFMYSPELRKVKRVSGTATASSLFGTDFSAEDFERLQGINRPGALTRLEDAEISGRRVHTLQTVPAKSAESAYTKIISLVDQETCVSLLTESYERGDRLRKKLSAAVDEVQKYGGVWVPQRFRMRDLRDETYTDLVIESIELDVEIADRRFSLNQLSKGR